MAGKGGDEDSDRPSRGCGELSAGRPARPQSRHLAGPLPPWPETVTKCRVQSGCQDVAVTSSSRLGGVSSVFTFLMSRMRAAVHGPSRTCPRAVGAGTVVSWDP